MSMSAMTLGAVEIRSRDTEDRFWSQADVTVRC